jgi:hypothetical protein
MANYTSAANGNWSSASTWTPSGVPGDGDTVTIAHNVTIDGNVTVGNDTTTPAIQFSSSVIGKTLTLAAGKTLTLKGTLKFNGSYGSGVATRTGSTGFNGMQMNSGSSLVLSPTAANAAIIDCTTEGNWLYANGTSSSHCTIKTDKSRGGAAGYIGISTGPARDQGLLQATYCDFIDLGTSSNAGVQLHTDLPVNGAVTITNCTFTRCSFSGILGANTTWDGNLTFQYNIFTSSTLATISGSPTCAAFTFGQNRSSGVRLIDTCSFDGNAGVGQIRQCKVTNCLVQGNWIALTNSAWSDDSYFNNVVLYSTEGGALMTCFGPVRDVYFFDRNASNPHYVAYDASVTSMSFKGCIFESSGSGGQGDCICMPQITSGTPTMLATNCIVLPDAGGQTSGKLISNLQGATSKQAVTAEHNTFFAGTSAGDGNAAVMGMGESADYAGEAVSVRANLCWSPTPSVSCWAVSDMATGGGVAGAVTLAGYNGFWNPTSSTNYYNTSTAQTLVGYNGVRTAAAGSYPGNGVILTGNDVNTTSAGGPNFVDATRCLAAWGGTTAGGGVATTAGAVAALAANPALIGQAGTGLLAWLRAGFRPRNAALKGKSYPGDASTADAAGNPWPGAAPDIGAMAVAAAPTIIGNPQYVQSTSGFFTGG